jgi:hypothetical protein
VSRAATPDSRASRNRATAVASGSVGRVREHPRLSFRRQRAPSGVQLTPAATIEPLRNARHSLEPGSPGHSEGGPAEIDLPSGVRSVRECAPDGSRPSRDGHPTQLSVARWTFEGALCLGGGGPKPAGCAAKPIDTDPEAKPLRRGVRSHRIPFAGRTSTASIRAGRSHASVASASTSNSAPIRGTKRTRGAFARYSPAVGHAQDPSCRPDRCSRSPRQRCSTS